MSRSIYIRLTPQELRQLGDMATEEHRSLQDQAVHLIVTGVQRWLDRKALEASLFPDEEVAA